MSFAEYDPLVAMWNWLDTLAHLLVAPSSPFWWPSLVAILVGLILVKVARHVSWQELRRDVMPGGPRRYLRQLPFELALMAVNFSLPILAAPVFLLVGAAGALLGATLLRPFFGMPGPGAGTASVPMLVGLAFFAFVASDFALYWTHRAFHRFPLLWRSHRLHHEPETLNPVTGFRFWPWEQAVHVLGATYLGGFAIGIVSAVNGTVVTPWEIAGVNGFGLVWNLAFSHLRHSHIALSYPRWLSYILVSPVMHHAHHSRDKAHHDKNLATAFAVWDWMFGTLYLPAPGERFQFGLGPDPAPEPAAKAP